MGELTQTETVTLTPIASRNGRVFTSLAAWLLRMTTLLRDSISIDCQDRCRGLSGSSNRLVQFSNAPLSAKGTGIKPAIPSPPKKKPPVFTEGFKWRAGEDSNL